MTAPLILYFRLVFLMEGVVTIKDTQRITRLTKKGKIGIKNLQVYFSNWLSQLLHYP
jgi:hypothetical protein